MSTTDEAATQTNATGCDAGKARALWRFAVRPRWSKPQPDDVAMHLVCPLDDCGWSQRIEPFGPDELGTLLRVAFRHLESAHEAEA